MASFQAKINAFRAGLDTQQNHFNEAMGMASDYGRQVLEDKLGQHYENIEKTGGAILTTGLTLGSAKNTFKSISAKYRAMKNGKPTPTKGKQPEQTRQPEPSTDRPQEKEADVLQAPQVKDDEGMEQVKERTEDRAARGELTEGQEDETAPLKGDLTTPSESLKPPSQEATTLQTEPKELPAGSIRGLGTIDSEELSAPPSAPKGKGRSLTYDPAKDPANIESMRDMNPSEIRDGLGTGVIEQRGNNLYHTITQESMNIKSAGGGLKGGGLFTKEETSTGAGVAEFGSSDLPKRTAGLGTRIEPLTAQNIPKASTAPIEAPTTGGIVEGFKVGQATTTPLERPTISAPTEARSLGVNAMDISRPVGGNVLGENPMRQFQGRIDARPIGENPMASVGQAPLLKGGESSQYLRGGSGNVVKDIPTGSGTPEQVSARVATATTDVSRGAEITKGLASGVAEAGALGGFQALASAKNTVEQRIGQVGEAGGATYLGTGAVSKIGSAVSKKVAGTLGQKTATSATTDATTTATSTVSDFSGDATSFATNMMNKFGSGVGATTDAIQQGASSVIRSGMGALGASEGAIDTAMSVGGMVADAVPVIGDLVGAGMLIYGLVKDFQHQKTAKPQLSAPNLETTQQAGGLDPKALGGSMNTGAGIV